MVERADWIPSLGAKYLIGIDGISLLLVMLTTLVGFLAILSSWNAIDDRVKEYYAMFLLLQTGMIGVFLSLDFFLFYVFWELVLVPMYFIIGVWGGPRKLYAAIKFFLYTLAGSVLMLLGILTLYFQYHQQFGAYTFEIADLMKLDMPLGMQQWVFWAFFIGFAIKVPMFPFHTWLPDAHVEAPTAGSVILASVLLKMGTYGFIRFSLPLLPKASVERDHRADPGGALDHRHHLRRAGEPDAAGLEEADGLFVGEPSGLLHAGHFRHESERHRRQRDPADQSRHLDRHAVPDHRRHLRAPAHARDLRVRRPGARDAEVRDRVRDRHAELGGPAAAQRLRRRVHDSAGRVRGQPRVGGVRRDRRDSRRGVSAVALSADHARAGHQRQAICICRILSLREMAVFLPLIAWAIWIGVYPKPYFDLLEKPVQQIVERVRPDYYQGGVQKADAAARRQRHADAGIQAGAAQ